MRDSNTSGGEMQGVHITSLELENVKKVKAVALEPAAAGLTVIGGRNGAGKNLRPGRHRLGAGRREVPPGRGEADRQRPGPDAAGAA